MATSAVVPDAPAPEADLTAFEAAADTQFHAALESLQNAPETPASPSETPAVAEPAPPADAPVEAAPAATEPSVATEPTSEPATASTRVITLDLDSLSPEARRDWDDFLAKGKSPQEIATEWWAMQRRLGSKGESPAEPAKPEVSTAPVVAPPEQVVAEALKAELGSDPKILEWKSEFDSNATQLAEIAKNAPNLNGEINYWTRRLGESDAQEDPSLKADITAKLTDLKSVRADVDRLRTRNEALDTQFALRHEAIRRGVESRISQETASREATQKAQAEVEAYASRFEQQWPALIQNAITTSKIGTELAPRFNKEARYEILGMLERGETPSLEALPQVLSKIAESFLKDADAAHRYMSRVYAEKLKAAEASSAVVVIPQTAPAPQVQTQVPRESIASIDEEYDAKLFSTLRGANQQ